MTSKRQNIANALKQEILGGRFSGTRVFPSERALAMRFDVSRPTVRLAMADLRSEGLISRRQGSGTFVTREVALRKVGLLVPDYTQTEYFIGLVREIFRCAQEDGFEVVFSEINAKSLENRVETAYGVAQNMINQHVSGVIFQSVELSRNGEEVNRRILSLFDGAKIPVALCTDDFMPMNSRSGYDVVTINNIEVGAAMCEHLISRGARRIHYYMPPCAPQSHYKRLYGAAVALKIRTGKLRDMPTLVADAADVRYIKGYLRKFRPDAIICGDDESAAKLMQTLQAIGYAVPGDVFLTGFNDLKVATLVSPPLTTAYIPCDEIARSLLRRIRMRIANPATPPVEIYHAARIVERASTLGLREKISKRANRKQSAN